MHKDANKYAKSILFPRPRLYRPPFSVQKSSDVQVSRLAAEAHAKICGGTSSQAVQLFFELLEGKTKVETRFF